MKKFVIISIVLLGIFVYGCKEDVTPTYTLGVKLVYPEGFTLAPVPDGTEIKVMNIQTGRETILKTMAGVASASMLIEGTYSGSSGFTVKVGNDEYQFNGILESYLLSKDGTIEIKLVLAKNTGGFILKEVYFAGSKTADAKTYYSDQFHEIYNNSNETQYADGLCIGVLEQTSTNPNVWVNADGSIMDKLPVTFHAWIVPGSGKQYPVLPGKSIVIAQDGIDHKTDPNGNPLSPVNMGKADFEAYVEAPGKDTDTPGVPNMTLMYTNSAGMVDWLHSVFGGAVIIFRLPISWQDFVKDPANFRTKPGSTATTQFLMISKSYVVDAIEIVRVEEVQRNKRLPIELDAGYTYLDGGTYCSKSIRRKAKLIIDGRVIYKDTNNSTVDFLHDLVPTPWVNPTAVEN